MKKVISILILVMAIASASWTVMADETDILILTEGRTNWNFTEEEVVEDDLITVLEAGVNTASAMNASPWSFSVVKDHDLIQELAFGEGVKTAPIMIIVSVPENNTNIFDAGLAMQSMQIAARILGYATKIEIMPVLRIRNDEKGEYRSRFGIPEGKEPQAALFVGHADVEADAVSHASTKADYDSIVTIVE